MNETKLEIKLRTLIKYALLAKRANSDIRTISRCTTLKNILETAQKTAKEKRVEEITDSMIIDAAKKEVKQLNELMEYVSQDDSKRIIEITSGLEAAQELLPKMATETEIRSFVESHKSDANNIGSMMKLLKSEFGDSLDGKSASQIVKTIL